MFIGDGILVQRTSAQNGWENIENERVAKLLGAILRLSEGNRILDRVGWDSISGAREKLQWKYERCWRGNTSTD